MSTYDEFRGHAKDAVALRQMAQDCRKRSEESFQRSDTDGYVSQFCSDLSARLYDEQAKIADNNGKALFQGLYEGDRRVPAKIIGVPHFKMHWVTVYVWQLRDSTDKVKFGRGMIPVGKSYTGKGGGSRVQKALGLSQRMEWDKARARIGGEGKGTAGLANAYVETYRRGNEWGTDASLCQDD